MNKMFTPPAAEENFLLHKFGEAYQAWAKSVPAFFPNLFLWRPASLPMSWRKILRKKTDWLEPTGQH